MGREATVGEPGSRRGDGVALVADRDRAAGGRWVDLAAVALTLAVAASVKIALANVLLENGTGAAAVQPTDRATLPPATETPSSTSHSR